VTARSRAEAVVAGAVAGLPAATLAEVTERAALQSRVDHKYLVPLDRFAELVARLPGTWAALEIDGRRGFAYESVYFDTPDLLTYRQHLQGRRRRYKVRTRAYLDSGDGTFEVKLKGHRDQTIKARLPYPVADRAHLTTPARAFLASQLERAYGVAAPQLGPVVTTTYRRSTLVDLTNGARLTCDVDLVFTGNGRVARGPSGYVLVETKSRAGGDADRVLRSLGVRPSRMSKYCLAVALLHPGIRANPWHRTLRRYFGAGADRVHEPGSRSAGRLVHAG
jgi:VTC domain